MREIEREREREIKISNVLIFLYINACLLKRQQTVFISTNQQNMIIRRIIHHDTLKGKSIVLLVLFLFFTCCYEAQDVFNCNIKLWELHTMIVVNDSDIQNVKFAVVRENRAYYHRRHICKPHVNNVYYQYTFNETEEPIVFAIYRVIICWF